MVRASFCSPGPTQVGYYYYEEEEEDCCDVTEWLSDDPLEKDDDVVRWRL